MSTDLPTELCREILTWLPTKPLLKFRCVCKEWRTIIDEPGLAKAQADHQIAKSCEDLLMIRAGGNLYSFSLSSLNEPKTVESRQVPIGRIEAKFGKIEARQVPDVHGRGVPTELEFPVSSCHGLILIMYRHKAYTLWNPFTGEWLELPSYNDLVTAESDRDIWLGCGGIGYDVATDDYKVVRLSKPVRNGDYTTRTLIYSMKSDQWRRIEDLHNSSSPALPGVFANGALHWIIDFKEEKHALDEVKKCVSAFDLVKETYRQIPIPSGSANGMSGHYPPVMYLDALAGCLFLTYFYKKDCFTVWILKNCDMWDALITFNYQAVYSSSSRITSIRPVAYLKSEQQVVLEYGDSRFLWYDVKKNYAKITMIGVGTQKNSVYSRRFGEHHLSTDDFSCQVFPQSLIRLDALKAKSNRRRKWSDDYNLMEFTKTSWEWNPIKGSV